MKKYTILLLLFILSGCTSKSPGDKYLKQISTSIRQDYNLHRGELIAKYNLVKSSGDHKCLFAKDYGSIVNNEIASQKFLNSLRVHFKSADILHATSQIKIRTLYDNVVAINAKHNVISKRDLQKLKALVSVPNARVEESPFDLIDTKPRKISADHFANLIVIDNALRHIPIFLPQANAHITSHFGLRKHPIYRKTRMHTGIDLVANKHAAIHAAADGKVIEIAHSKSYGNFILIEHNNSLKTRYAHLSKLYADSGERIFQGQLIGLQGGTGHVTGDHLHFEVIYNDKPVDPMLFVGPAYKCKRL